MSSDPHDRFTAWITDGAREELPRDAGLHASACDACLRHAAAFDALLAIDPGAAALPPLTSARPRAVPSLGMLRAAVGAAAVVLLAVLVGIGAGGLLDQRAGTGSTLASPTPEGEGILAGAGGPSASPTPTETVPSASGEPSESADASSEPEETDEAAQTPVPGVATPRPVVTPRPTAITPPIGTPRPTSSAAATPAPTAVPSAPPSATPPIETPVPTPVPTPVLPTPTPSPSDPPPSEATP